MRGLQALTATQACKAGGKCDVHTKRREHALGVIAGGMWLAHHGVALRIQPGQQQRGLHLRTGHLQRVVDAG